MKSKVAFVALIALAGPCALQAQSDEPAAGPAEPTFNASLVEQELLDTLVESFERRFAECRAGVGIPGNAIRLNKELYELQISRVQTADRPAIARTYLSRAEQIEEVATRNLEIGLLVPIDLLETKAARLRAQLEFAKYQN